jgi:hypothetical protein
MMTENDRRGSFPGFGGEGRGKLLPRFFAHADSLYMILSIRFQDNIRLSEKLSPNPVFAVTVDTYQVHNFPP